MICTFLQRQKWGANIQVNNLFNVKWNEAQFATETQLKEKQNLLQILPILREVHLE
jgi:hypothetical protein